MRSRTYYASRDMFIQSRPIEQGQAVGQGDPEAHEWTPAEGLEAVIGLGHFLSRAGDGRFTTENPGGNPPSKPKRRGRPPKASKTTENPGDGQTESTSTADTGE